MISDPSTVIRPSQSRDSASVWRLLQIFATSYTPNLALFESGFSALISRSETVFLVAEQGEVVVGYLLAHTLPTLFAGGPVLEIVELVVDAEKRGQSIGRALVEHALTEAWSNGCVEAVAPTRRAAVFYERMRFEPTATLLKRKRP